MKWRPLLPVCIIACSALVFGAALAFMPQVRTAARASLGAARGQATVADRLHEFGAPHRAVWRSRAHAAGLAYPAMRVTLLALKEEKLLVVYAASHAPQVAVWQPLAVYPILAASGAWGPKLREGDMQVPEGMYAVESLNPNSRYHAALRVGYPSADDRAAAEVDGRAPSRTPLGGDIMIHGNAVSAGCLAMGDPAIEELFTLVADVGVDHARVIIVPWDLRTHPAPAPEQMAAPVRQWLVDRYTVLARELAALPPVPGGAMRSR